MRQYLPMVFSVIALIFIGDFVVSSKYENLNNEKPMERESIGMILKSTHCEKYGNFFQKRGITTPVTIDLSQKRYKGIALYYGKDQEIYHPTSWERFGYFETYTVDKKGNLYLIPMPFISITEKTFENLKNLYKIDTDTGKLLPFFHFDDVHPSSSNPFGLKSVAYDCDNDTLWVSAIDESNYMYEKGVIYHIDPEKKILSRLEGWDALSLAVIRTDRGKFLFFGSARENALYALKIEDNISYAKPEKLFELPSPLEHVRKIKVVDIGELEIQTIPFSYTLITESSNKERNFYTASYNEMENEWYITKK